MAQQLQATAKKCKEQLKSLDHEGKRNAGQMKIKKTVNGYAVFNKKK